MAQLELVAYPESSQKVVHLPIANTSQRSHGILYAGEQTPGGFGGGDGMEPRVAVLEAHMEHVREDLRKLSDVPDRLGRLEVKIDHLAGKADLTALGDKLTTRMQIYLGIVAALVVIGTAITKFL